MQWQQYQIVPVMFCSWIQQNVMWFFKRNWITRRLRVAVKRCRRHHRRKRAISPATRRAGGGRQRPIWISLYRSTLKTIPFVLFLWLDPLGLNTFGDQLARDTFVRLAAPFFPYLSPISPFRDRPERTAVTDQVVVFLIQDGDIPLVRRRDKTDEKPCLTDPSRTYGISVGRPQWPVCYAEMAALLEAIQSHRPAAVFLDVAYPKERPFRGSPKPLLDQIRAGREAGIPTMIGVFMPNTATTIQRGPFHENPPARQQMVPAPRPFADMAAVVPQKHWVVIGWPKSRDTYPLALTSPDAAPDTSNLGTRYLSPAAALYRQLHEMPMSAETHARFWPGDPCLQALAPATACAQSRQQKLSRFDQRIQYSKGRRPTDPDVLPDVYMTPLWPYFAQPTGILDENRLTCRDDGFLPPAEKQLRQDQARPLAPLANLSPSWQAFFDLIDKGLRVSPTLRLAWQQPVHSFCYPVHVAYPRDFQASFRVPPLNMDALLAGKSVIVAANSSFSPDEFNSPVHGRIPASFQHAVALQTLIAYGGEFFSEKKIQVTPNYLGLTVGETGVSLTDLLEILLVFCAIFLLELTVERNQYAFRDTSPFFQSLRLVCDRIRITILFTILSIITSVTIMIFFRLTPFNWPAIFGTAFLLAFSKKVRLKKCIRFCKLAIQLNPGGLEYFCAFIFLFFSACALIYTANPLLIYGLVTVIALLLERFTFLAVFGKLTLHRVYAREGERRCQ